MVNFYTAFLAVCLFASLVQVNTQGIGEDDIEQYEFLVGNAGKREVPINLGDISYACVGNIHYCSDGFTMAFWLKVDKGYPNIPAQYFVSSGGQSAMSEGYYVRRNYGKEFEVGVAKQDRKWTASFFLLDNSDTNILFTWSRDENSLEVYADGILVAKDTEGKLRVFTEPRFDPWRNILVGKANDDRRKDTLPEVELFNVTHWAQSYSVMDIGKYYQKRKTVYYKGCAVDKPGGATDVKDVDQNPLVSNEVVLCREHCSREKYPLSLLQNNKMCSCYDSRFDPGFLSGLDASVKCSSETEWEIYWASSIDTDPDNSINLEVDIIYPTDKGYTKPGEEIVFEFTTNTVEPVIFECDYGDGETVRTLDELTSHHWKSEGSFTVTITAVTRLNQETKNFMINITDVDEGIGPEMVRVKASPTKTSHQVEVYATAISKVSVDCVLQFGDGTEKDMKGLAEFVNNIKLKHVYPLAGFYDLTFSCDNGYGSDESKSFTVAQNRKVDYVTKRVGEDIMIPLTGGDNHIDHLQVLVNNVKLVSSAVTVEKNQVILHASQFPLSGEYLIQIKSGWFVLHQRIANFQDGIRGVSINVNKEHLDGNEPIEITFVIQGGDHTHLHIKYGDGKEEFLYYPNGGDPLLVTKTHIYKEMGWYTISIIAANDVGFVKDSKMVTSERQIKNVSVSVANVTTLGQPAEFIFEVDMDMKPAMPFSVMLDYDNGYTDTVRLGKKKEIAEAVAHNYTYRDYGIYYFTLKVNNNVSTVVVTGMLQVGQNITYVDMVTQTERVEEGQMAVIEVDSPHGSPLIYNVDMGDGNTVTVTIPEGLAESSTPAILIPEDVDGDDKGSGDVDTPITTSTQSTGEQLRKKRSVDVVTTGIPEEDTNVTTISFVPRTEMNETDEFEGMNRGDFTNLAGPYHKNDKMVIKYKYTKPGRYSPKVQVYNPFNEASTWLCPDIIVVPKERVEPICSQFEIEITTSTSMENPLILPRSEALVVQTVPKISCGIDSASIMPDFTWKTARKPNPEVSDEEWRTELEVCQSQLASSNFTIPGNSLWYGTYRLTVSLGMSIKDNTGTRRKRDTLQQNEVDLTGYTPSVKTATGDMYIKVVPSDLKATFAGDGKRIDVPKFNILKLDISESNDPDVPVANKTGMWAEVVCYSESRAPMFEGADPAKILENAKPLATNMLETVSVYDVGGCIVDQENIAVHDWDVLMIGSNLIMNESVVFEVFVHKDTRMARATQDVRAWPSGNTGDLMSSLDDLLSSGDASAALMVLDIVAGGLGGDEEENNTDAKAARSEMRGKLIDAIETVSSIVKNPDQLDKTVGVLGSVVAVADEVSDEKKGTAASALNNSASKAGELTGNVPLDKVTNMAGGMVSVAGNVLPFEDEEEEEDIVTTTTFAPRTTPTTTTIGPSSPRRSAVGTSSATPEGGQEHTTGRTVTVTTIAATTTTLKDMSAHNRATMAPQEEVTVIVSGNTRLTNMNFTEALNDHKSEEFKELADQFCSWTEEGLNSTTLSGKLIDCEVINARPGSIVVDYSLTFQKPSNMTLDDVNSNLEDVKDNLPGTDKTIAVSYATSVPTVPSIPDISFTTITPTMMATSLVFSPSTLSTSYVGLDMSTTIGRTTTVSTTAVPFSTSSAIPTSPSGSFTGSPGITTTLDPPLPTEPPEPPCCERVGGLCEWVEPPCEHLDEDERKSEIWDDEKCDEQHPDDIGEKMERFQMYKDMMKRQKFARRKKQANNAMGALNSMGDVLLGKSDKDSNITIDSPKLKMSVAKVGAGNGTAGGMNYPGSALEGQGDVGAKTMESANPFTFSDSAAQIKTNVKALSFTYPNGTAMKMENTSEPFQIWLDGKPEKVPQALNNTQFIDAKNPKMAYHTIVVPGNDSGLHIEIVPENPDDKYQVYISYRDFPNDTHYDFMTTLPNDGATDWSTDRPEELAQLPYLVFPPTEVSALNGSYRVGVKLIETKISLLGGENGNYTYSFRAFLSGCRFWNEEEETWSTKGCQIGNATTMYRTECLCNHLTSFGGDFAVPPNTIDFSTVFSLENFIEAIPVFVTVGGVLIIYVIVLVWARREDKKDLIKWGACPLEDNLPTDRYHYQMAVYTGTKKKSGTSSKISFILSGDESDTGVRRMFDGKRKEHPTGSIYNYVLSVEGCLGPLTYLRIWHDNNGNGKKRSWNLGQIIITDLQTNDKYVFLLDRWLAVEEDDGAVERVIPVAGMKDLTSFKHLFNGSVRKKMTNDHIWVSVMSRPTRSNFTRVQRISCCVALLYLTMITNCMFFKGADEKPAKVEAINIGPVSFTMEQLIISIQTTLIVFPPSMFIVVVFRKSRPKKNTVQQENQQASKKFKWRSLQGGGSSLWYNTKRSRMDKFKESMRNIVNFHKRAKYAEEEQVTSSRTKMTPGPPKKKKGFSLPHWWVYIAWIVTILTILASAFFTVLYSMQWGREKSLEWLGTFFLTFFQSVVVVQPIKVLLFAAFLSCVLRKPDLDDDEDAFDDGSSVTMKIDDELLNCDQDKLDALIERRKKAASDIQPPDMESLNAARDLRMKEMAMEALLKEIITYAIFVMVVFFLSYQARDSDSFQFAENIKNTFFRNTPTFASISKPPQYFTWLENTTLPNLYVGDRYNGDSNLTWRDTLTIDDRSTIRLGVARIRQHRIKDDTCKVQPVFKTIIHHCRDDYGWTADDTKDYLSGWVLPTPDNWRSHNIKDCYMDDLLGNETSLRDEESPWIYRNSVELKQAPYAGTLAMYKGGGYTFTFKRTRDKTQKLLKELADSQWLDVNTRAVFLEFTVYNANVNLFASVIMLIEFMSTGGAVTREEVKVFRLSSYVGTFGYIVLLIELVFCGFILYFFYNCIKLLRKEKLKYFKDFWNLIDFVTFVMAIVTIAMYAMKKVFGAVAMSVLKEAMQPGKSGEYVNFVTISIWDETFGFILALVVFFATLKFIKMLKFNKRMGMLGDTILLATKDLKTFVVIFFIYFFAFAQCAFQLFGKTLLNFSSFIYSCEELFAMALGAFDFNAIHSAQPFLGPLFFFIYIWIVSIGLLGMFLTIIDNAFAQVKANTENQANDYEIVEFMMKKFKGVFGWS